jgi:aerobic carbon-monoxide dehydrogenase medium subunit
VKPSRFDYHRPATVAEAAELMAGYEGDASALAGGQSLVPMLNFRLARPRAIVDLNAVDGLSGIHVDDGSVRVRAMTRQRDLEQHVEAVRACPLLGGALANVAHQVVRNRGTVGGSIAHGDAAAELPAALRALDGRVRVQGTGGDRWIEAGDLYEFHLSTSLEPDEILVEAEFPRLPPRTGTAVMEVTRRHGDYALAGVCAVLTLDEAGSVADARLGYLGVAPTTVRAHEAERALVGEIASDEAIDAAAKSARDVVDAIDEEQASVAYRRRLVEVLTARALRHARRRSTEAGEE